MSDIPEAWVETPTMPLPYRMERVSFDCDPSEVRLLLRLRQLRELGQECAVIFLRGLAIAPVSKREVLDRT